MQGACPGVRYRATSAESGTYLARAAHRFEERRWMMADALKLVEILQNLERELTFSMSTFEAKLSAVRILISRLGESDCLAWWASSVWSRGHALYAPIFRETWPKQRLILSLAAARVADHDFLRATDAAGGASLFALDPALDARIEHKLRLLDLSVCISLGDRLKEAPSLHVGSLASLRNLETVNDLQFVEASRELKVIIAKLAALPSQVS
jgi:hypothetical protein